MLKVVKKKDKSSFWKGVCQNWDSMRESLSLSLFFIYWEAPPENNFKLNCDSSVWHNGLAGGRGVIRNHLGDVMLAFSVNLGLCFINLAELEAIAIGI